MIRLAIGVIIIGQFIRLLSEGVFSRKKLLLENSVIVKYISRLFKFIGWFLLAYGRYMLYHSFVVVREGLGETIQFFCVVVAELVFSILLNKFVRKYSLRKSLVLVLLISAILGLLAYKSIQSADYFIVI